MTGEVTRRLILRGGMLGVAGLLGTGLPANLVDGAALPVRRDINSLSVNHPIVLTYAAAVRYLRKLPASDRRSWTYLTTIHLNWCVHQNWYLLPWHREYMLALERIIRSLPPGAVPGAATFALPYWDWTRHPRLPAAFTRRTLADGSPNPLFDATRTPGTSDMIPSELVGAAALRRVYRATSFEAFASARPDGQTNTLGSWQRVTSWQGTLEATPHNGVHNWIGGRMATMSAPRDPLFFLHHANVDRIWASWNSQGHPNTTAANWSNFTFARNFARPSGSLYDVKVRDIETSVRRYDRLDPVPIVAPVSAAQRSAFPSPGAADTAVPHGTTSLTPHVTRSAARSLQARAVLRILQLTVPPEQLTDLVRVFMNRPGIDRDWTPEGLSYVGTLAFFGGGAVHVGELPLQTSDICAAQGKCFSFEFPLTDLLDRWRTAGLKLGNLLTVQLVPLRSGNRLAQTSLRPAAVEVAFY